MESAGGRINDHSFCDGQIHHRTDRENHALSLAGQDVRHGRTAQRGCYSLISFASTAGAKDARRGCYPGAVSHIKGRLQIPHQNARVGIPLSMSRSRHLMMVLSKAAGISAFSSRGG